MKDDIFTGGSWFLPQGVYPGMSHHPGLPPPPLTTCDRFPSTAAVRNHRSSPYPRVRSHSPPHSGKLYNKFHNKGTFSFAYV